MYCIKNRKTGEVIADGFKSREEARPERNELNKFNKMKKRERSKTHRHTYVISRSK